VIFKNLVGEQMAVVSADALDVALCRLERSSAGLDLGREGLGVLLSHDMTIAVEGGIEHLEELFPSLSLKVADFFLDAVLRVEEAAEEAEEQGVPFAQEVEQNSEILKAWHVELLSLAVLPLGTDVRPTLLYSVKRHGLSFKTLLHSVQEYDAPIVFVAKDTENRVFGFSTPNGLRDTARLSKDGYMTMAVAHAKTQTSSSAASAPMTVRRSSTSHLHIDRGARSGEAGGGGTGGGGFALFQLLPEFRLRRWRGYESGRNFIRVESGWGIGLGGQAEIPRLKISDDLKICSVTDADATYAPGPLLSGSVAESLVETELATLEIWGLGTSQDFADFERRKRDLQDVKEDRKKVDKRMLIESDFDKEMFFEKTFAKAKEERP
jgi:hypothetical protein